VKFFLDHDVAAAVKDALERHDHEVIRLADLFPAPLTTKTFSRSHRAINA
jgi:hypothetical protein